MELSGAVTPAQTLTTEARSMANSQLREALRALERTGTLREALDALDGRTRPQTTPSAIVAETQLAAIQEPADQDLEVATNPRHPSDRR